MRLTSLLIVTLSTTLWTASPARADDAKALAALAAVGPLDGSRYDPGPVITAINLLQPLGPERGLAVLRKHLARTRATRSVAPGPSGLFAVIRVLFDPPAREKSPPADACTPRQRAVAAGGCFRPPRLGGPVPAPPKDLRSLRYPIFVLGDVPLSLVSGYILGGHPEPLGMHLDALAKAGTWRKAPLKPKTTGEIRYLFVHYGQWGLNDPVGKMVESQLKRLDARKP